MCPHQYWLAIKKIDDYEYGYKNRLLITSLLFLKFVEKSFKETTHLVEHPKNQQNLYRLGIGLSNFNNLSLCYCHQKEDTNKQNAKHAYTE